MLRRSQLHDYQVRAVEFQKVHVRSVLWLDMSLGKTVVTLTAISDLLDHGQIWGALILAPRRVAETVWLQEARKWAHLSHLKICILRGSNRNLVMRNLARREFQIHVINYESLPWLCTQMNRLFLEHGQYLPWNMLVLDELTRVKNTEGKRVNQLYPFLADERMATHFPWRTGLTGTPAPNGYFDLFGQYYALDDGRRLGNSQQVYKEKYFIEDQYARRIVPAEGSKEKIEKKISDITMSLRAKDYLTMPKEIYNYVEVDLPPDIQEQYERFEKEMFAELDHGTLEVFNMASLTAKCRQLANGNLIDTETKTFHPIHDAKLEALDSILGEASGSPVLVPYQFRADMERILERYGKMRLRCAYVGPGTTDTEVVQIINDWNRGMYHLLTSHPQSMGHGLNLQYGGHQIAWFGQTFNLEHWLQTNGRIARQGQPHPQVIFHVIVARGTIDMAIRDAVQRKTTDQEGLRDALDRYRATKHQQKVKVA